MGRDELEAFTATLLVRLPYREGFAMLHHSRFPYPLIEPDLPTAYCSRTRSCLRPWKLAVCPCRRTRPKSSHSLSLG